MSDFNTDDHNFVSKRWQEHNRRVEEKQASKKRIAELEKEATEDRLQITKDMREIRILKAKNRRLVEAYKEMKAVEPELATHTNRGGYRDSEHRRQHHAAAKEFREALASMEKDDE